MNAQPLQGRDWRFIGICALLTGVALWVILNWFTAAFPEASIDFRYDRSASLGVAEPILAAQGIDVRGLKHTATFDSDDSSRIFLERSLGLTRASAIMKRDVHLWWWSHRWFLPLQEEEYRVDIAPTGELTGFSDKIPEDRPVPTPDMAEARALAERFLTVNHVSLSDLQLVSQSERRLPHRSQRIFTWESRSIRPAGAPDRVTMTVDGNRITGFSRRIKVPEEWQRQYRELRSKNLLAGNVDTVFLVITMIAAVVIFITRLMRGDLPIRMLLGLGITSVVLVSGVALNSYPGALAEYVTTSSYPAFLGQFAFGAVLQGIGVAMLLIVIVGSGEVLYRQRLPQHLAIPRIWTRKALSSKRVFLSFILGYSLVALFMAYQVAFYVVAGKFGAWAPAEVPYDEMLNSAFPWIAVLFAGFFPALSEEFMSRAFSIPFFEKLLRSRVAAIVLAGFIWGFGHATYPNQPFYIRGVEVGCAGVILGFLLYRFGLLPLLIWHYTVDALYTAMLLLRSGNRYYVISGALSTLVFAIPMVISIVLYIRNKGFIPDDDLSNATMPPNPEPVAAERPMVQEEFPQPLHLSPRRAMITTALVIIAAILVTRAIPSIDDVIDYRITRSEAKKTAAAHLAATQPAHFQRSIATPVEGFRSWDRESGREEGGAPGGFDSIAATYLLQHGLSMPSLTTLMRERIPAATWMVRFFAPRQKDEWFLEVDPRKDRVVGYHKYQDEKRPGPRLEQAQAQAIASAAFARYGVDRRVFDVREALNFQQPNRRDWLFHFEERQPIVAGASRRVSVRVAGAEVTQFTSTIKIPDLAYRQPTTVTNIVLSVLKVIGGLMILALIVAGFVTSLRTHHFPWKRALVGTGLLAIVPIAAALSRWESDQFTYSTSIGWNTFLTGHATNLVRNAGLQLGLIFLAIAAIDIAYPQAFSLLRRSVRARLGRHAAAATLAIIAMAAIRRVVLEWIALRFPGAAAARGFDVSDAVAIPFPALLAVGEALVRAIIGSAAVGLFIVALRGLRRKAWIAPALAVTALLLLSLDPSATAAQRPLMLASAATTALLAWLAIRWFLSSNLFAYPLAIAVAMLAAQGATLMQNHRPDLIANGVAELVVAAGLLIWAAAPGGSGSSSGDNDGDPAIA